MNEDLKKTDNIKKIDEEIKRLYNLRDKLTEGDWVGDAKDKYPGLVALSADSHRPPMYFITSLEYTEGSQKCLSKICHGYFYSFKNAETVVINNYGNLYDKKFRYIVIEALRPGFQTDDPYASWYQYNKANDKFEKIPIPEWAKAYYCRALTFTIEKEGNL